MNFSFVMSQVMLDWQERLALLLGRQGIHQEATGQASLVTVCAAKCTCLRGT